MIKLIYGAKGAGKTKKIIEMANDEVVDSSKCVVFLTDTDKYLFQVSPKVRFYNAKSHNISTEAGLFGYINGILDSNNDIETFYIDGNHRIVAKNVDDMKDFYEALFSSIEKKGCDLICTVSKDKEDLPDYMKKFVK